MSNTALVRVRGPAIALAMAGASPMAVAHFQMIIPTTDVVVQTKARKIDLDLMFWHPLQGNGMNMMAPDKFGVMVGGDKIDLLSALQPSKRKDRTGEMREAFKATYSPRKPGDHIFYVEPKPYWEPAEETFIIHYTKVVVNAFGLEEGWDQEVGMKAEIVPLARPYGLWAGNSFRGVAKLNGKPVPFTEVEVEYYDPDGKVTTPVDPLITQVIKADANGMFSFTMPWAGWWGVAALNTDEKKMSHNGKEYPVEIGAVLWLKTYPAPTIK